MTRAFLDQESRLAASLLGLPASQSVWAVGQVCPCSPVPWAAGGISYQLWVSVGQVNYPKVADSSSFDEDSSDALSPEQPASHESQGSVPSPLEARVSEPLPSATSASPTQVSVCFQMLPQLQGARAAQSKVSLLGQGMPPALAQGSQGDATLVAQVLAAWAPCWWEMWAEAPLQQPEVRWRTTLATAAL